MSELKIRLEKEIQNLGEFHQKYNNLKAIYEDMRRTLEVVKVQTRLFHFCQNRHNLNLPLP